VLMHEMVTGVRGGGGGGGLRGFWVFQAFWPSVFERVL
jgi:hypothetical protein